MCRDRFSLIRCLLAEQVYTSILRAYHIDETNVGSIKNKIFGARAGPSKGKSNNAENMDFSTKKYSHTQKFLARIMGKATSVDNLTHNVEKRNNLNVDNTLKHSMSTGEIPQ